MEFSFLVCLMVVLIRESVSYVTWKTIAGCKLDSNTLYPWLVSIWFSGNDQHATKGERYGHGVLITYKAVLTACSPNGEHTPNRFSLRNNPANIHKFYVYAQRINARALVEGNLPLEDAVECDIVSRVTHYVEHPKCRKDPQQPADWDYKRVEQLFNFAGFVLESPFPTSSTHYPTLPMPRSPENFIGEVSSINIMNDYGCEIVWFEPRGAPTRHIVIGGKAFEGAPLVKPIPFQSQCLQLLCEERPNVKDNNYKVCAEFFGNRANATRLCMKPKWTKSLTGQINGALVRSYVYVGAPLVCNGTGYGHVTFLKERPSAIFTDPDDIGDFFFVTTYLRVWPWIMEFKRNWTAKTTEFYIERENLKEEEIPSPTPKPFEQDDVLLQYRRPNLPFGFGNILREPDRPKPKPKPKTRAEGTHTAQTPFVGSLVISCFLAISNWNAGTF